MQKVILIIGASSGMGKESAKKLIQQGHKVYAVSRRVEQMQDLKTIGGIPMQMDVTNVIIRDSKGNTPYAECKIRHYY